jgi:hypothetical protein
MQSVYTSRRDGNWPDGCTVFPMNYLVIAGGGGGGCGNGGGGGGGGYRNSFDGPSPLKASSLTIGGGTYTVTVGAGGARGAPPSYPTGASSVTPGSDSIFNPGGSEGCNMITSTGGGAGGTGGNRPSVPGSTLIGAPGGSGGGGNSYITPLPAPIPLSAGIGNTPPFSPPQGNPGGPLISRSGGGGAIGGVGPPGGQPHGQGSPGAPGLASSITGSPVTRGGGGGGGIGANAESLGLGGPGGGGPGGRNDTNAGSGTANTGGGGGGGNCGSGGVPRQTGGAGGSGIVVIRVPSAKTVSVAPCTNTVTSCVGPTNDKVATFTVTGTLTIS